MPAKRRAIARIEMCEEKSERIKQRQRKNKGEQKKEDMAKVYDPQIDEQIHNGRREKLRALFLKSGLESFNEVQVLEYALGMAIPRIDTNPTAHRLINAFGSLGGVIEAHPDKLKQIDGVGQQCAFFLSFLKQFVTYYLSAQTKKIKIKTPQDAMNYLKDVMRTYSTEQFVLICLDKAGCIILQENTSSDDLDKVNVNLKQLTDIALRVKTSSVILAHNHLDGNPMPSDADIQLTRFVVNVFSLLSINTLDHIIFTNSEAKYSFSGSGVLDILKREHKMFTVNKDYEDYMMQEFKTGKKF